MHIDEVVKWHPTSGEIKITYFEKDLLQHLCVLLRPTTLCNKDKGVFSATNFKQKDFEQESLCVMNKISCKHYTSEVLQIIKRR